jgi:predicted PurR-regulated permease PerM
MLRQLNLPNLYFAAVLLLVIYLLWMMMKPFLGAIIFAAIITGSIHPVYMLLLEKIRLSPRWAAIFLCFLIIIVVFLPTVFLLFALSKEAITLYQNLAAGISNESLNNFLFGEGYVAGVVKDFGSIFGVEINMDNFVKEVINLLKRFSGIVITSINKIVGNLVVFLFDFVIMILVIYALLAEGAALKKFFLKFSPLPDDQEQLIIDKFNQMNFVTLVTNGLGGLIQGVLAGIGFWIAGINLVVLWTTLMIILAFIPLLGISIVYIPTCIYLVIIGKTFAGIALFIYCSGLAFVTENWFKPLFIGKRIQINSLFVLFTIIGGMTVFGFGGIFYGPVIAILFLTMVELYHKYYATN